MDTNSVHDLKGSISLRALETGSGFRFFFDDDEESYFDLNLEKMEDSEEFEFQISFSPLPAAGLPAQYPADELFQKGRILPLQGFQVVEARSILVPSYGEQQVVYPEERLLPESWTPVEEAGAGRVDQEAQLGPSLEKVRGFDGVRQCMEEQQHQGLAGTTRKTSKVTSRKINSGVMRFLVKFPSEKIRSTFMSILKSYQFLSLHPKRGQSSTEAGTQESVRTYKRLAMQFSRWLASRKRSHNKGSREAGSTSPQRPSDVDLDENVVRSILDAVDFAVGSRSRGAASSSVARQSSSFARSTAPKGMEGAVERNSSINSAIAHCKMSYGSTAC